MARKSFRRRRSIGIPYVPSVPSIFFLYNVDHIRLRNMDIPNDTEEADEEIPKHISDIISRASKTFQDNSGTTTDTSISQVQNISTSSTVSESSIAMVDKDNSLLSKTLPSTGENKQDEINSKITSSGELKDKLSEPKDTGTFKKLSTSPSKLESSKVQELSSLKDSAVAHHTVDRYENTTTPTDSDVCKESKITLPKRERQKLPSESKSSPSPPDTGFVKSYSSHCSKHPGGRRIVPNIKPKLCDSCTVSMLSYISVLQDFLKGMSQDITSQQTPSSQCFECAKERLLISPKASLEIHTKHNVSRGKPEDTFDSKSIDKSFVLQDPKRGPSKYYSDGQNHKGVCENGHVSTSFDHREKSLDTRSPLETNDRNVEKIARAKLQFTSDNHLASSEMQVNDERLKDQSHPTLQHPHHVEDIPYEEEEPVMRTPPQHVASKDQAFASQLIREHQTFPSQKIGDQQDSSSRQIGDNQAFSSQQTRKHASPSQQVCDQRHYDSEESAPESPEDLPYSESDTRATQKHIQPNFFGDQISSPTPADPYTSSSPFSPRNNKDGILSTLSNEEREVYDSARGVAGWERLTEPHGGQDISFSPPQATDEAFVTMAGTNAEAMSCLVLGCSLLLCRTSRVLCVLITDGVSASLRAPLSSVFHVVQSVRSLDSLGTTKLSLLDQPDLGVFFRKLHVWRLVQFSKCVFLNPDTMVVQNCDELFCHEELSAVPDIGWPDCFNSGMFVYQPSVSTFWELVQFAENQGSYDGGDQGLLNTFFSAWSKDIHKKLSFIYNLMANVSYTYTPAFRRFGRNVKIVQFQGAYKPWHVKFYTETGQISPSSVVHPTYVQFVYVWIRIFKVRVLPLFSQEIQSYATSQRLISSSELLRFFPSEPGTELDFLLTPPSVRTRHDPQTPIPIFRNSENIGSDSRQIRRRKSLPFQQDTEVGSPAIVRQSHSEEDISLKSKSPKETLASTLSTEEAAVVEHLSEDSQLDASDSSAVIEQKEAGPRHLIPGSDLGDYQGMAAWEQGRMDYMGSANSEVILSRLLYLMEKSDRLV